jgi:2-amino-4-hydroxy-6-hydroxymethyldihydropteridine diphosphokinase
MNEVGPVLIAFGANLDPLPHILAGLRLLHAVWPLEEISTVYRSRAVGDGMPQPDFLNGAVRLQPTAALARLDPLVLRTSLRGIEQACGRQRGPGVRRDAPRTLDLDIALMGAQVIRQPPLRIPDPDMLTRPFLAQPLAELAPEWIHPVERIPLRQLAVRTCALPDQPIMVADEAATTTVRSLLRLLCS